MDEIEDLKKRVKDLEGIVSELCDTVVSLQKSVIQISNFASGSGPDPTEMGREFGING